MSHFTKEQLQEIATVFGLEFKEETLPVRDGVVTKQTMVWWWHEDGPKHEPAIEHWENIKGFPNYYSLKEPMVKVTYLMGMED